ncbi:MAG TPA: M20/M25/M40 family metallo-hydrolase [Bacteroidales bacterium]|nr:M20/M25/M40 family metallo-hydrolase [Bacteroidales bacterium]
MKIKFRLFIVLSILTYNSFAQSYDICSHIKILASDSLTGRKPGTPGIDMSAAYIRSVFQAVGLKLYGDNGFQKFDVVTDVELGAGNSFVYNNHSFVPGKDYIPYSFSIDTTISASCVFAGYGFSIKNDSINWDDYENTDVKNKWVIVLRGLPELKKAKNRFEDYSSDRSKALTAKDHGAAGILLVTGEKMSKTDELIPLSYEKSKARSDIAVINITRNATDKILVSSHKTLGQLEYTIDSTLKPLKMELPVTVKAKIKIDQKTEVTSNVVAMCMNRQKSDDYIIIGAHYDHLGMGGKNSGSRSPDTNAVHNGADDNASGTALLLEMANYYAKSGHKTKYNIIFVAFSAEEMGLLGSSWFVKHLPVEKEKIKLMLNFDMVGRLNVLKTLSVGGTGTFPDAEKIVNQNVDTAILKIVFSKEGYGPSDHASFYADSIPVLYFNTGVHQDYHMPSDDADKVNCNGLQSIAGFVIKIIDDIGKNDYDLSYHEAGPKDRSSQRMGLKVTLGIMPDFTRQDIKGVPVGAVNEEGPAHKGGMKKNDVIIAIDGKTVNDIYEYMARLKTLTAGQIISVDIIRDGKKEALFIQL